MTSAIVSFLTGLLFALGLGISGMTRPSKVIAFLDVSGSWDPSLALVMVGAIVVHASTYRFIMKRRSPLLGGSFAAPATTVIDRRLFIGAAVFGIGWGLIGYCPGPAVTAIGGMTNAALWFVPAMLAGMLVERSLTGIR